MKGKATLFCIATAMLVAGTADAAQLQGKESQARKAAVEKIKANQRNIVQPRTMAQAANTTVRLSNGATAISVPTELYPEMRVERDSKGNLRIRETEGDAPVAATQEATNE